MLTRMGAIEFSEWRIWFDLKHEVQRLVQEQKIDPKTAAQMVWSLPKPTDEPE